MRSGAVRIGLGSSAEEDDELSLYGHSAVTRGAARWFGIGYDPDGSGYLEVDWKKNDSGNWVINGKKVYDFSGIKKYKLQSTIFGKKLIATDGSEFPKEWTPNQIQIPWSPDGWSSSSTRWPESLATGPNSIQPETNKSFLDVNKSSGGGSDSKGSTSPGGRKGFLTWIPRGLPEDPSDYLKWLLIIGGVVAGVIVLDFATKE